MQYSHHLLHLEIFRNNSFLCNLTDIIDYESPLSEEIGLSDVK